jgi:hypothetical protein
MCTTRTPSFHTVASWGRTTSSQRVDVKYHGVFLVTIPHQIRCLPKVDYDTMDDFSDDDQ